MAYTDLTSTFGYKVAIISNDLVGLMQNDLAIKNFIPYNNRPSLQRLSATEIRLKANNRSALDAEADILFPDGVQQKFVQNDPLSKDIFDITREGVWDDPTPANLQGGLRDPLVETANTWYAIYGVRDSNFGARLIGDDTLPLQVNVSALNTRYGQNRWVYLGMVRNGDNADFGSDLLDFVMVRNRTYFKNSSSPAGGTHRHGTGIIMASGTVTDLDWPNTPGTGALDTPDHLKNIMVDVVARFDTVNECKDSAGNHFLIASGVPGFSSTWRELFWTLSEEGVKLFGGGAEDRAIHLYGFADNVLGLGYYAQV